MEMRISTAGEFDRALSAADEGDRIVVTGRVRMPHPIRLTGKKGLIFRGEREAAFDFMLRVDGFSEVEVNGRTVWYAQIPAGIAAYRPYAAFREDGAMLSRPRLPKTGYYRVKGSPEFDLLNGGQRERHYRIYFNEGEVPVMRWPETAQVRAFHWWTDELLYLAGVDYEEKVLTFSAAPQFAMKCENSRTEGARWYLDNVFEALSDPREYYISPDCRKIWYVPDEGDRLDGFGLYVSTSEELLTVEDCENITFDGIGFKGSDRDKLWLHRSFSQAAVDVPCAVNVNGSADVVFTDCRFTDIGLSCLGIDRGSHDVTVDRCAFTGIGGNPVHIRGRNVTRDEWKTTYPGGHVKNEVGADVLHGIHVTDCLISDYGRVYCNACGILLQYAYDCDLSHNEIHDGYYTGISVGWVWGYAPHATNHIRIEYNHIYSIGKALLSDMGGIYTLGQQEGTVIRGNRIHDVEMDSYGGWGVYLDEGSSDILVEGNICYDLSAQPFHQHYGSNNLLRHNIFAFGEGGALRVTRREEHLSIILERNILVSDGTAILANTPESMNITDCMNLIWNYQGEALSGPMNYDVYTRTYSFPSENQRTPAEMQAGGLYAGVLIADPLFRDPSHRDFTLLPGSPAAALGFDIG